MEEPQDITPEELSTEEPAAQEKAAITISIQSWATPIIAILMLVIGFYAGVYLKPGGGNGNEQASVQQPSAAAPEQTQNDAATNEQLMSYLLSQERHSFGDANAPVTIFGFSDFQWPYCGRFATGAERQIRETYINTGKVRFVSFHFAFLGQESQWAAEASECASDQDAFWEYYDFLYEHQNGENQGAFNKDHLKEFAGQLGLDETQFNECLDSGKYTDIVTQEKQMGQQIGVQSTPTFLVNGTPIIGAQPFENFQQVIESILNGTANP